MSFERIVQNLIGLLEKENSDQGLHYLPFHLHHMNAFVQCKRGYSMLGQLQ